MSRWSALHPFLIALYLVLRLVAVNEGETYLDEAARSLALMPSGVAVAYVLLRYLFGGGAQAGVLISTTLAVTWSHGVAHDVFVDLASGGSEARIYWTLFAGWLAIVIALAVFVHRHRLVAERLVPVLNTMAAVLLLFPVAQLGWRSAFGEASLFSPPESPREREVLALDPADEELRDIYLIVLDAYARSDVLRELYGFDNGDFVAALRERGFFVAAQSRSNFATTRLVLPSILNYRYFDDLAQRLGGRSKNMVPLIQGIRHNRVVDALRKVGYRIVRIGSGAQIPSIADYDEALLYDSARRTLNPFESVLLGMTPFVELFDRLMPEDPLSSGELKRRRVDFALDQLAAQGERPGPKFVDAHIAAPHQPFVYGPNGEKTSIRMRLMRRYPEARERALGRAYTDQIRYLNGRVREVLDRILAGSSPDPIVILMGDHSLRLHIHARPDISCLRDAFAILNAIRLPGLDESQLYDSISPVNTFRTVFDAYFGTKLGRLPDRSLFSGRPNYYDFVEVTDKAESCSLGKER